MDISVEQGYPTPFANSPLLPLLLLSLATQKHTPKTTEVVQSEYDYIIVGAGAAGSVLANRLSEKPCVSVLLLEAGKPPPRLTDVPAIPRSFIMSDIDWDYRTEPQRHTGAGLIDRKMTWPSGKTLGGSTVINAMFHVRGNKKNYELWAAGGATGWNYSDVLPYFKKLEDNQDQEVIMNGYHGVGGPVTVHKPRYNSELLNAVNEAITDFGYSKVDSNGPTQTGFFEIQANLRNSQRCSTAKAYLVPAENRTNLDIVPNAFVKKVLIMEGKATGVQFDFKGNNYQIKAKREVILSAGTVNSAQLLMLSGVGPEDELRKHNIPVKANLPVGRNFQDHCGAFMGFVLSKDILPLMKKLEKPSNIRTYVDQRTGPLSSTEGVSNIGFLQNQVYVPPTDVPDHEIYFLEAAPMMPKSQLGIKPGVYNQVFGPYENESMVLCISQILHPKSRGHVKLDSSDPYTPPLIDPNYFDDPQDLRDVVEGLKTCKKIGTSNALKKIGSKPFETLYPGCEDLADDEDEYFKCQTKSVVMTLSHQVGTAKMGDPNDSTTVVDTKLRVKGIQGLRVVDASVMPLVPSGNTNVPTIMIAEKASDMIKETIQCN